MNNKLWIPVVAALLCFGCQGGQSPGEVEAQEMPEPMGVTEFVRQTYFEGVPYAEASKYDASAVPVLVEMLQDPQEEAHWGNVVAVLGCIGDEDGVQAMIDFIGRESEGTLSPAQYRAKNSAMMSLGYAVNAGNGQALEYLKSWLQPAARVESQVAWESPMHASAQERDAQLSKTAILGLALAGTPEAAEALRAMQQQPAETEEEQQFQAAVSDLVSEAISTNETIAADGLEEYYRQQSQFGG